MYTFTTTIWKYPGKLGNWYFASLPKKEALSIKTTYGAKRKGWGSIPVIAKIGDSEWATSVFPDTKSGTYLLPIKASIRKKQGIFDEKKIQISITINTGKIAIQ